MNAFGTTSKVWQKRRAARQRAKMLETLCIGAMCVVMALCVGSMLGCMIFVAAMNMGM